MITAEQMAQVRATFPAWDDLTIRRHLEQRAALERVESERRQQRLVDALRSLTQ